MNEKSEINWKKFKTEDWIDREYEEPKLDDKHRFVYFLFADTNKMEEKYFENEVAAFITGSTYTHVELMFWDVSRIYRIIKGTDVHMLDRKNIKSYYMVVR